MKSSNSVLILIGIVALGYLGLLVFRPEFRTMSPIEVFQILLGDTKDSLSKEKFSTFKAADAHFKVAFPGTPSEINIYNSWLHPTLIPLPGWFMADREMGFFVSETQIANSDAPGRMSAAAAAVDRPLMGQGGGNNEMVAQSNFTDVLTEIQEFLTAQSDAMVKNAGASFFVKTPASSGGGRYFGRNLEGSAKAPGTRYRLQVFYDQQNKRLFAICVQGKPEAIQSRQASQFLNSLQILP